MILQGRFLATPPTLTDKAITDLLTDNIGRLQVVTTPASGGAGTMVEGLVSDGSPVGTTKPVLLGGKDGGGVLRTVAVDSAGKIQIQALVDGDINLTTSDQITVNGKDGLGNPYPLRVDTNGILQTSTIQLPSALTGSGNLKTAILEPLPAGTNTLGKVDQGANGLVTAPWPVRVSDGVGFISPATDRTTAIGPFSMRLSDGGAFYDAAKTGQLPAALTGSGNLKVAVLEQLPAGTNIIGEVSTKEASYTTLGFSQITVSVPAIGITAPGGTKLAVIDCQDATVRYRSDGTDPTPTVGKRLLQDGELPWTGPMSAIKFIRETGTDGILNVEFYG